MLKYKKNITELRYEVEVEVKQGKKEFLRKGYVQPPCGKREQKEREIISLCDGFGHSLNKWKVTNIWFFY